MANAANVRHDVLAAIQIAWVIRALQIYEDFLPTFCCHRYYDLLFGPLRNPAEPRACDATFAPVGNVLLHTFPPAHPFDVLARLFRIHMRPQDADVALQEQPSLP